MYVETTTIGMQKLIVEGLKKWPHSPDVLLNVFANLQVDSSQAVTKMIDATVDALPAKKAIMSLGPINEDTALLPVKNEYRQMGLRAPIERLVENIWLARVYFPDDRAWNDRVAVLKQTLITNGWGYLLEESSSSQRK